MMTQSATAAAMTARVMMARIQRSAASGVMLRPRLRERGQGEAFCRRLRIKSARMVSRSCR